MKTMECFCNEERLQNIIETVEY